MFVLETSELLEPLDSRELDPHEIPDSRELLEILEFLQSL